MVTLIMGSWAVMTLPGAVMTICMHTKCTDQLTE